MLGIHTSDSCNPVWLKEMRQTIRSRMLRNMLIFAAAMQLIGFYWMYAGSREPLHYLYLLITLGSAFFMGIAVIFRTGKETGKEGLDAALCSQLNPLEIIVGKTLAIWTNIGLTLLVMLPLWLALQAPFRWNILGLLILGLLALTQLALWLSLVNIGKRSGSLAGLALIFGIMPLVLSSIGLVFTTSGNFRHPPSTGLQFCLAALAVSVGILAIAFAVTTLRKPHRDRAKPSRITFLVLWAAWLPFLALLPFSPNDVENCGTPIFIGLWSRITLSLLPFLLLAACGERLSPTPRMVAESPRTWLERLLSAPVTGGAANGLLTGALMLLIALAAAEMAQLPQRALEDSLIVPLYCFFYAAVVIQMRRRFKMAPAAAVAILLLVAHLPLIAAGMQDLPMLAVLSPAYAAFELKPAFQAAVVFALIGAALWLPELFSFWRKYRKACGDDAAAR